MKSGRQFVAVTLMCVLAIGRGDVGSCNMTAGHAHANEAPASPHAHDHSTSEAASEPGSPADAPLDCTMAAACSAPALAMSESSFLSAPSVASTDGAQDLFRYVAPTLSLHTPPPRA